MEYSHSRGVFEELFAGFEGTIYLLSRGGEVGVEDEDEDDEEEFLHPMQELAMWVGTEKELVRSWLERRLGWRGI